MEAAIRVENLSRISARFARWMKYRLPGRGGTIFGFLGPNGAGKSTTIRLLLGLLAPSAGRAEVLGWDCSRQGDDIRQHTGVVFHNDGLYDRLTAEQNLAFYPRIAHLSNRETTRRVRELLSLAGLTERSREPVNSAAACGKNWPWWGPFKLTVRSISRRTFQLSDTQKLCHLIAVIREGRIVAAGRPNELMEKMTPHPEIRIFGAWLTAVWALG